MTITEVIKQNVTWISLGQRLGLGFIYNVHNPSPSSSPSPSDLQYWDEGGNFYYTAPLNSWDWGHTIKQFYCPRNPLSPLLWR